MNVVFFGASVTAQAYDTGYFQVLSKTVADEKLAVSLFKVAYGGSNLNTAAYSMLSRALELSPKVCFLDWVTPSADSFEEEKLDLISRAFLSIGCLPVWAILPRADDPNSGRTCCEQVRKYCAKHEIPCLDFVRDRGYTEQELPLILRDVVHTNSQGAQEYSSYFLSSIVSLLKGNLSDLLAQAAATYEPGDLVRVSTPRILQLSGAVVDAGNQLEILADLDPSLSVNNKVEVFIRAKIGPAIPFLSVSLFGGAGEQLEDAPYLLNCADPWCYYEREMLLPIRSYEGIDNTKVKCIISAVKGNPLKEVDLRKDFDSSVVFDSQRNIEISEVIVTGSTSLAASLVRKDG